MINYGFTFNNKHSINDFGLIMEYKKILPPAKKKIKLSVPYMNDEYDFSTVGSNGEQVFEQRTIDVKLDLISQAKTKEDLQVLYSQVCEWLLDCPKNQLIFDDIVDFYFMAEVENISSFEDTWYWGFLELTFICDSFKYGTSLVGSEQLWNSFNFITDYLQDTEFDVNDSKTVTIYNPGRIVVPTINVSDNMNATLNGYTTSLTNGDNTDYAFILQPGANIITINGTGNIKFIFRKESL